LDTVARLFEAPFGRDFLRRCSSGPLLAVLVSIPLMIYGALLPEDARQAFVAEWGVIENSTVVLYGIVILGLFAVSRSDPRFFVAIAAVVALVAARELDVHKAFTTGSVTSLRYYTGDTPLAEKLVVGGIMTGLALFLTSYVGKYVGPFRRRLKCGHGDSCSLLTAIALLSIAQILDSFKRIVPGVSIKGGTMLHFGLRLVEEVFELAVPLILLWAIGQYASSISHGRPFTVDETTELRSGKPRAKTPTRIGASRSLPCSRPPSGTRFAAWAFSMTGRRRSANSSGRPP